MRTRECSRWAKGVLSLAVAAACAGGTLGATDTQTGTNGAPGVNGAPGAAGGNGGDGGTATANASSSDASNTATATGGNGGAGGTGGNVVARGKSGGNGGDGGAGGAATAIANMIGTSGDGWATATAAGGTGGTGGNPGSSYLPVAPGHSGIGGAATAMVGGSGSGSLAIEADSFGGTGGVGLLITGGAGGTSHTSANVTAAQQAIVYLTATGGTGGSSTLLGGAGGIATIDPAYAVSTGGAYVYLSVTQTGGNGGDGGYSGQGGSGAASTLINAVRGSTSGVLSLSQDAVGGNGGMNGGSGGNAYSSLTLVDTQASFLSVGVGATGGNAGDWYADATNGTNGSAVAGAHVEGAHQVTVDVSAKGGTGGYPSGQGKVGSDGGAATLQPIFARSLGNEYVSVTGTVTGGDGLAGGNGASAIADNVVDGATGGELVLQQNAFAGGVVPYSTAEPGSAISNLSKTAGSTRLSVVAQAQSGNQRPGFVGGAATATARAVNLSGEASAGSNAAGGAGYPIISSAVAESWGDGHSASAYSHASYLTSSITGDHPGNSLSNSSSIAIAHGNSAATAEDSGPVSYASATNYGNANVYASAEGATANASAVSFGGGKVDASTVVSGASAPVVNTVTGFTTGAIVLEQEADGGLPTALSSTARSILDYHDDTASSFTMRSQTLYAQQGYASASAVGKSVVNAYASAVTSVDPSVNLGFAWAQSTGGGPVSSHYILNGNPGCSAGVTNAADGSTTGALMLIQDAAGGPGIIVSGSPVPTPAGSATSVLSAAKQVASLSVTANATGGRGTGFETSRAQNGGTGGSANAVAQATNGSGPATAATNSLGGAGTDSSYQYSGSGGDATSSALARTSGDGNAAIALGLAGGGRAGDLVLSQGTYGHGGNASSQSTATVTGNSLASATDQAKAGDAFYAFAPDQTFGGSASSSATATSPMNTALSSATATGGFGTVNGSANAISTANTSSGTAQSDAIASGLSGAAESYANAGSGIVTAAQAHAIAAIHGAASHAQSRAAVSQSAPAQSAASGLQAAAFLTALPSNDDSLAVLGQHLLVHQNFNVAGEGAGPAGQVFGLMTLDVTAAAPAGQTQDCRADASEEIDLSKLSSPQDLLIGLMNPIVSSTAFDSLEFRVSVNGSVMVDQAFADPSSAEQFFTDRTLDLGALRSGSDGQLDLSVELDMTGINGAGFTTQLIAGNATLGAGPTPEPGSLALMVFAAATGLLRRRRRAGAPGAPQVLK